MVVADVQGVIFIGYTNGDSETGIIFYIWKWIHIQAIKYCTKQNNYGYGRREFHFPVCLGQTQCMPIVIEFPFTLEQISAWMIISVVSPPKTFRMGVISHSYVFLLLSDLIKTT